MTRLGIGAEGAFEIKLQTGLRRRRLGPAARWNMIAARRFGLKVPFLQEIVPMISSFGRWLREALLGPAAQPVAGSPVDAIARLLKDRPDERSGSMDLIGGERVGMAKQAKTRRAKPGPEGGSSTAPDVSGQDKMRNIKSADLEMDQDAINHWQDEPEGPRKKAPSEKSGNRSRFSRP
jgi:hypothetical protein